jgi:hypothetical protein
MQLSLQLPLYDLIRYYLVTGCGAFVHMQPGSRI